MGAVRRRSRTDRIVRGGENIAPAEVEAVLLEHPAVAEAAVVARPDPVWGQVPAAAVVLEAGAADPGDDALAAHCRGSLAGFKVPVAIVRLDVLPRTRGGKVRREAVRALLAGEPTGTLARPGGDAIGWRVTGSGGMPVLLLPGTLSSASQLDRLAAALAGPGDVTVHAIDRRGTGSGRLAPPRPLDAGVHLDDLVAYLDARGIHGPRSSASASGVCWPSSSRPAAGPRGRRRGVRAPVRCRRRCRDPCLVRDARRGHGRGLPHGRAPRRGRGIPAGRRRRRRVGAAPRSSPGIPRREGDGALADAG